MSFGINSNNKLNVSIIGGGSFATAIANIVCENVKKSDKFNTTVKMWIYFNSQTEEKPLADIINEIHVNTQFLPNIPIEHNLLASSDIGFVVENADMIIFCLPHQFIMSAIEQIKKKIKKTCYSINLAKGIHISKQVMQTYSEIIANELNINCSALSGANVATELAKKEFCESTIGYDNIDAAKLWAELFNNNYFKITCIPDLIGVQICGALKNVIALGAGFSEALGYGSNTKSAIIRIGILEMQLFASVFSQTSYSNTLFESCGFADIITTCINGRHVKCAREFAKRKNQGCTWETIEAEILNGMKLQGNIIAKETYELLQYYEITQHFPLLKIIYEISYTDKDVKELTELLQSSIDCKLYTIDNYSKSVETDTIKELKKKIMHN